jgi:hypothetical protein
MNSAISVLLSAAILACPYICHAGHAAGRSEGKNAASCACCRGPTEKTSHDSQGGPKSPHRSGGCPKGICNGAVVENGAFHDFGLDTSWSLPVADLYLSTHSHLQPSQFDRYAPAPWPDDGTNRGRALCCLFSTLLC